MVKHLAAAVVSAAVVISPGAAFAQREPDTGQDSLGALAAFRDPRAPAVRAIAESSLARLRAVRGSSWRVLVNDDLGTATWISVAINEASPPAGLTSVSPEGAMRQFLALASDLWHTGAGRGTLLEVRRERDELGYWHFTLAQRFGETPVYGGQVTVHVKQVARGLYSVYAAGGRAYPVTALASAGRLPQATIEANVRERLAARGARASRALRRWIVGADGQYVVAWEVAFGDSGSVAQGTAGARAFVREDDGSILAFVSGERSASAPGRGSLSARRLTLPRGTASGAAREASGFLTPGSGRDVFNNLQSFGSTPSGTTYQLVDQTHKGASEIRVYDNGGIDTPVASEAWLSTDPDDNWGLVDQRDDVSGVVNGGKVIDYWYQTHGRLGMENTEGPLRILVNAGSGLNAFYSPAYRTIRFYSGGSVEINGTISQVLPVVGAEDVVFHEFQHGVNDAENASDNLLDLNARSINEGLADYFGATFTNSSCLGDTIITSPSRVFQGDAGDPTPPGCVRDVEPDVSTNSSTFGSPDEHLRGLAAVSALWDARKLADHVLYDRIVYRAIRVNYIPDTPDFLLVREAVVQAAKDLEHDNTVPPGIRPSRYTEDEFHQNAIGGPGITLTLSYDAESRVWEADIQGPPNLSFNARMEAGSGVNNDESIDSTTDVADNDPQFTLSSGGMLHFFPGQLGWYNLRAHSPGDGHYHAVRVRVPAQSALGGELRYYESDSGGEQLEPRVVAGVGIEAQTQFSLSQLVGDAAAAAELSVAPSVTTGVASSARALVQRSGITGLRFGVPGGPGARSHHVRITIYDLAGRVVRRAVDDAFPAGLHDWQWDTLSDSGVRVPSGAYVAIMIAEGFRARRVLVVR